MRRTRPWLALFMVMSMLLAACSTSKPATTETKPAGEAPKAEAPKSKYPEKPIQLIVPYSAGGSTDLLARAVEKVWPKYSNQQLLVVTKSGAGGMEGREYVVRANPDGYNLLFGYGSGEDLVTPQLRKLSFDTFGDLVSVARLSVHSIVVAVPANSPYKTLKELIDAAKKDKKPITAAVSTAAGSVDLVMRGIGKAAGVEVTTVPHAGGSQAVTTLVGGQTMMGGGHPSEIMPHVKSGRLRAIGVALPERDPALPDVPTLKEQGIDFYTWGSVKGIAVAKNTPADVIAYLEDVFKKISEDADFKKAMADLLQPVMYQNSKDFAAFMKQAYGDYGKLIKELDIKLQ